MKQQTNRAEQLWKNWEETQKGLERIAGTGADNSRTINRLKYDFLRQGLYRLSADPSKSEQLYLHVIRSVTAKLEKQLYPHPVARALHRLKALLYDRPVYLKRLEKQRTANLERLMEQMKVSGFASFTGFLETHLDYERPQISIPITTKLGENTSMDIDLKMEHDGTGEYIYTGYRAELYLGGQILYGHTFTAESGITASEAANLLEGRAVRKSYVTSDGSTEQKWIQLDFRENTSKLTEYRADYCYDLKKELLATGEGLGVNGLGREKTIRELEAGKLITVEVAGRGRHYLYANPAGRSIRAMDADKRPVQLPQLIEEIRKEKSAVSTQEVKLQIVRDNGKEHDRSLGIH